MVSVIGRRCDGRAIGKKKKKRQIYKNSFSANSHIFVNRFLWKTDPGIRVKTHFLVLSHGFIMFWQLKPGPKNCKDSDSPCGESKPSLRSSSRDRVTDVSTEILEGWRWCCRWEGIGGGLSLQQVCAFITTPLQGQCRVRPTPLLSFLNYVVYLNVSRTRYI